MYQIHFVDAHEIFNFKTDRYYVI